MKKHIVISDPFPRTLDLIFSNNFLLLVVTHPPSPQAKTGAVVTARDNTKDKILYTRKIRSK